MPIPVTKYTCRFKCGAKAINKISAMAEHENNCWNNPDNKTCKTCVNEVYTFDSDDYRQWTIRGCKISVIDDVLAEMNEIMQGDNAKHIMPVFKCPCHDNQNIEQANEFAETLKGEIPEYYPTVHFPFFRKIKDKENTVDWIPF